MIVLIDGYNLLKKIKHSSYISDKERENFIKKIAHYAHQKKLSIVLVFDGGHNNWPLSEAVSRSVTVVYSGVRESADDYIKQYIETHASSEMLLVSSDRELVSHARQYRVASLGSHEFSEFLYDHTEPVLTQVKKDQQVHKLITNDNKELDFLMSQLTMPKKAKESEDEEKVYKRDNKLSKAERKLVKKIKKL